MRDGNSAAKQVYWGSEKMGKAKKRPPSVKQRRTNSYKKKVPKPGKKDGERG